MTSSEIADPLVVIGCFRSGTSAVAMALASLGAYFGEAGDLIAADASNQEGYWEHKPLLRINRSILNSLNVPQFDIDFMPDDWAEAPPSRFMLAEYEKTIRTCFAGRGLWGYKDPETTLVLPLVKHVFAKLGLRGHYVLCARNPIEVAESEFRRIGHDRMLSLGSWMQHILFGLTQTIGESRTLVVFDDLLADQERVLRQIVESVPGWFPTQEQWRAAMSTQKKELVHARSSTDGLTEYPDLIARTYALVCDAANDQGGFREGDYDERIRSLDREYRQWLAMLRLQDPPRGSLRVEWQVGGTAAFVKEAFEAKRSWKTIGIDLDAPPDAPLQISLYQTSGTLWIRSASFLHGGVRTPAQISPGRHGQLIDDQGIPWLWPRYGTDQIRSRTPKAPGPYRLEMEVLVATGVLTGNRMWQGLSEQIDQLMARTAPNPFR